MKKHLYAILFSISLICFTVYIALDTFVLTSSYSVLASSMPYTKLEDLDKIQEEYANSIEPIIEDDYYKDGNVEITLIRKRYYNTDCYIADVKLRKADYFKSAFANDTYGKNITAKVSKISAAHNAILAINGDFYGVQQKGYVLKDGKIYRSSGQKGKQDLVITKNGDFRIITELKDKLEDQKDAKEVLAFGPGLIDNYEIIVGKHAEVAIAKNSNPRTAIGQIDELHYIFLVSDGRTSQSDGLTLHQVARVLKSYNVKTGYNLDGGGSSTMIFNGKLINIPMNKRTKYNERKVSDIVYIG